MRAQLLVWVNLCLALATAVFLYLDYEQEYRSRIDQQRVALSEEARAMLYAIGQFQHRSPAEVLKYIDAVCAGMNDDQSPGHHIVVRFEGETLQANSHSHLSTASRVVQMLEEASQSRSPRARIGEEIVVVGSARQGTTIVYVTEKLDNIRRDLRDQLLWRFGGIIVLTVLAAVVVNSVILRLAVVPIERLTTSVNTIAQGHFGEQTESSQTAELALLAEAINAMSRSLGEAEQERRVHLERASRIQAHLHPRDTDFPGMKTASTYQPASGVGGDFFDISRLSDDSVIFCIADVSGHGIGAALEAVVLKLLLMQVTETESEPARILGSINERFDVLSLPEDFATMFVARWDPDSGLLHYASAGHEPAYLLSTDGRRSELSSTGPPLGIQADCLWESGTQALAAGDQLYLVTDGLAELADPGGNQFGRERLNELFFDRGNSPLETVVQEIDDSLRNYRAGHMPSDDLTLLGIEFEGRDQNIC